jgi:hypothetical protein
MSNDAIQADEDDGGAWETHNVSQLVYFRSLSLSEKMQAVQGMADVVRRFEEMRAKGEFHLLSGGLHPGTTPATRPSPEPGASSIPGRRKDDSC